MNYINGVYFSKVNYQSDQNDEKVFDIMKDIKEQLSVLLANPCTIQALI